MKEIIIIYIICLIILVLLFNISGYLKGAGEELNNNSLLKAGKSFEWLAIIYLVVIIYVTIRPLFL
jgi:hypothetical protein